MNLTMLGDLENEWWLFKACPLGWAGCPVKSRGRAQVRIDRHRSHNNLWAATYFSVRPVAPLSCLAPLGMLSPLALLGFTLGEAGRLHAPRNIWWLRDASHCFIPYTPWPSLTREWRHELIRLGQDSAMEEDIVDLISVPNRRKFSRSLLIKLIKTS